MNQFKNILRLAKDAFRANWLPGIILQTFGIAIVLAYYTVPSFHEILGKIGQLKVEGGYLFSAITTSIFGGLIPFLVQMATEKDKSFPFLLKTGTFITLFWAYRGLEVDLLYRYQAIWFGNDMAVGTIIKKTLLDQFIYMPFWCIFIVTFGFMFKDCGLSFKEFRSRLNKDFMTTMYPTAVFSTWIMWIPAVAIIYSLPLLLQIPMMNLVVCFYGILMIYLTRNRD